MHLYWRKRKVDKNNSQLFPYLISFETDILVNWERRKVFWEFYLQKASNREIIMSGTVDI